MGCVSSKLFKKELKRDIILNNGGDYMNHVVSLTSSTYGVLNLDNGKQPIKDSVVTEITKKVQRSPTRENKPEVINAWELMEDLEEGMPISNQVKKSPKTRAILLRGFADMDPKSPLKFLNQIGSPRKSKSVGGGGGKENNKGAVGSGYVVRSDYSPRGVLKVRNSSEKSSKAVLSLSFQAKGSPKRDSFSPLFDPDLVASYEKELNVEGEQIKRMVSPSPNKARRKTRTLESSTTNLLQSFTKNCPKGGENAVVIYTTTLRGIRKTFEDCNKVRSIIESHLIHVLERDISMDSGFKEELRKLMGKTQVKVPLVFVKGRLIGGAEQVVKLEEEGKLGALFDGIPQSALGGGCEGCAGFRFVMCMACNGSCKVLDEKQKQQRRKIMMVRCVECNENGLVQCPICC
ncbi:uncharacterized protein At3g28850 [Humulus lupulus]|uniref:uncharacterized protein At3g28850 n=1 Tax=Humulus lupulus TaxID=3486 RepID=UPI002B4010D8|nr:uncharacterized protein At3g28850 [Humulus lupulus]